MGQAGQVVYASNVNTMVFCNGANWVSMAGGVSVTVTGASGATPAGSTADVQYNNAGALSADTGNFTYSAGLLKAPTISATNVYASGISATTGTFGSIGVGNLAASGYVSASFVSATGVSSSVVQLGVFNVGTIRGAGGNMISSGSTIVSTSSVGWISFAFGGNTNVTIVSSGNVGIGTPNPGSKLEVSGSIVSHANNAGAGTSIDFSLANVAYTSAACGAFTLSGMADGGSYMLGVTGSGTGPASFSHAGLTVKTAATLTCTSGKATIFSFTRMGSNVYVTMVSGY